MLAVSYSADPKTENVQSAEAAHFALQLTQEAGCTDTVWLVLDRKTGEVTQLEQSTFEHEWEDNT